MAERKLVADGGARPAGPVRDGIIRGEDGVARCWWGDSPADLRLYHDYEWGFPVVEDAPLFEKLVLEGFQAGLSWLTILRKREGFRRAFAYFDFEQIARFGERDIARLLADRGIVRHRGKIEAAINNAQRAIELVEAEGSFAAYVWRFEPDLRARPRDRDALQALAQTPDSEALARDLKRRGWRFVGPTTVYAFMQEVGLVNDHLDGCDAGEAVAKELERFRPPLARPVSG